MLRQLGYAVTAAKKFVNYSLQEILACAVSHCMFPLNRAIFFSPKGWWLCMQNFHDTHSLSALLCGGSLYRRTIPGRLGLVLPVVIRSRFGSYWIKLTRVSNNISQISLIVYLSMNSDLIPEYLRKAGSCTKFGVHGFESWLVMFEIGVSIHL